MFADLEARWTFPTQTIMLLMKLKIPHDFLFNISTINALIPCFF